MSKTESFIEFSGFRHSLYYMIFTPVAVFMLFAAVMAVLSVQQKTQQMREVFVQNNWQSEYTFAISDSAYYQQIKDAAFLKSRAAMITNDSACLTIDIKNKVATIELQGVPVHNTGISNVNIDRLISETDDFLWIKEFSFPHYIDSTTSSISKQTFIVKNAPSDSTENQGTFTPPDTSINQPVYFSLFLSNGFTINIFQQNARSSFSYKKYALMRRFGEIKLFVRDICRFKIPDYRPQIDIELPARDAKTIYKSLPARTQITLRLE